MCAYHLIKFILMSWHTSSILTHLNGFHFALGLGYNQITNEMWHISAELG